MDNVRVRRLCDELLHLEDPGHKMHDEASGKVTNKGWMKTLQTSVGSHVHGIKLSNNPNISIGGYFIISQMLGYIQGLVTLDLSSNELTAAEARVLSIGLRMNSSLQDVRLKENSIGSEGATNIADALKVNDTLLTLDLRMNSIRGAGICMLADAVSQNKTLISVDVRWNYAGECSDFVEMALLDLKDFCLRNLKGGIARMKKARAAAELESREETEANGDWENEPTADAAALIQAELDRNLNSTTPNGDIIKNLELDNERSGKTTEEGGTPTTQRAAPQSDVTSIPGPESTKSGQIGGFASRPSLDGTSTAGAEEREPIGRVEVTILNAKNLPQVIWTSGKEGEFLGLPQAYCTCTLGRLMHQTGVMKKSWNPSWSYRCALDVQSIWNVCTLKVMHSKSLNGTTIDDYMIGMVNLPMGSITNWRGVTKGLDGTWRAFYKPSNAGLGHPYEPCVGKDRYGNTTDTFDTSEGAAKAYDEVASKKEGERAALNFAGEGCNIVGLHVKEDQFPLAGEDGVSVIGIQAGVSSAVRLQIKYFDRHTSYLEIYLDRASSLPKMDSGLGSCDAYSVIMIGDFQFRSRVVRNSLDPHFNQVYRISVPNGGEDMECRVQVWDWDRFDENDHIGDAVLRIASEKITTPGALDGAYAFIDASGTDYVRNGRGEKSQIHLRFKYYEAAERSNPS
eukprot:CAMPEP_0184302938 /NCGR_PEP_ID=MMETSP1049-20130417/12787_1 /TAXON_ID=77928 /ORGANISM="Proteomonas sulcata, Strain CCMP704" /LENGTH=681 /DNA_ID=CAMNT_0026614343 /DNA_START=60 /DNA_END=2105 /DNA_ORIENTATION=-